MNYYKHFKISPWTKSPQERRRAARCTFVFNLFCNTRATTNKTRMSITNIILFFRSHARWMAFFCFSPWCEHIDFLSLCFWIDALLRTYTPHSIWYILWKYVRGLNNIPTPHRHHPPAVPPLYTYIVHICMYICIFSPFTYVTRGCNFRECYRFSIRC